MKTHLTNALTIWLCAFRHFLVPRHRMLLTAILAAVFMIIGVWSLAIPSSGGTRSFQDLYKTIETNAIEPDTYEYRDTVVFIDSTAEYTEGASHLLVVTDQSGYRGLHRKYVFVLAPQDAPRRFAPGQRVRITGRVAQIAPQEPGVRGKLYDHLFSLRRQIGATQSGALTYFEAREISVER